MDNSEGTVLYSKLLYGLVLQKMKPCKPSQDNYCHINQPNCHISQDHHRKATV